MVTESVIRSVPVSAMVPLRPGLKVMVAPGLALASWTACARLPAPDGLVLVTLNVTAAARGSGLKATASSEPAASTGDSRWTGVTEPGAASTTTGSWGGSDERGG